jgi:hypothetical protein
MDDHTGEGPGVASLPRQPRSHQQQSAARAGQHRCLLAQAGESLVASARHTHPSSLVPVIRINDSHRGRDRRSLLLLLSSCGLLLLTLLKDRPRFLHLGSEVGLVGKQLLVVDSRLIEDHARDGRRLVRTVRVEDGAVDVVADEVLTLLTLEDVERARVDGRQRQNTLGLARRPLLVMLLLLAHAARLLATVHLPVTAVVLGAVASASTARVVALALAPSTAAAVATAATSSIMASVSAATTATTAASAAVLLTAAVAAITAALLVATATLPLLVRLVALERILTMLLLLLLLTIALEAPGTACVLALHHARRLVLSGHATTATKLASGLLHSVATLGVIPIFNLIRNTLKNEKTLTRPAHRQKMLFIFFSFTYTCLMKLISCLIWFCDFSSASFLRSSLACQKSTLRFLWLRLNGCELSNIRMHFCAFLTSS